MIKKEQAAYMCCEVLQTRVKLKPSHSHRFIFKE